MNERLGRRRCSAPTIDLDVREKSAMRRCAISLLALSLAMSLLAIAITTAFAAECPAQGDSGAKAAVIRKASSCDRAMQIFKDCEYGASGDVALGQAVRERCESGFLHGLDRSQRAAYERKQQFCAHKYAKESGTMYRSFEAFCGAEAAQSYFHKFATRR